MINVQGTDHHSTVTRVRAGLQALGIGIPQGYPDYVLHKMVTVMRGGEEVKISKRAGSYVTLRDLIDEVGRDAVRFFLVSRKADTEFVFDIDLARSQTRGEPGLLRAVRARARRVGAEAGGHCRCADASATLRRRRPGAAHERVRGGAAAPAGRLSGRARASRRANSRRTCVTFYLKELAAEFHSYYNAERFLVDDRGDAARAPRARRRPTGQVLRNGLAVLGISAPEKM